MGNINALPVVSQTKSLVQVAAGDQQGALETQIAFSRQCPIVSQVNSAVQAAMGDKKEAKKIQEEDFMNSMESLVDALPLVGHIKGAVHYALDQDAEGDRAVKAASRTTGVVVGGVVGALGGPAGAVAGGILGGTLTDGLTTAIDSAVHDQFRPSGLIQEITVLATDDARSSPGAAFDAVAQVVFDGLGGYGAGNNFGTMDAPSLNLPKPPGVVGEPTKIHMKAIVYRKKTMADDGPTAVDQFESDTSKSFMHGIAGKYIKEAVLEAIQKSFGGDIITAKEKLDAAKKANEGKDEKDRDDIAVEKAQAALESLITSSVRYEVHLISGQRTKDLCIPFAHLGWKAPDFESKFYAKFNTVCIVINIEAADKESYGHSHRVKMMRAHPVDSEGIPVTWKKVAKDSARVEQTQLYDIDAAKVVTVKQLAPEVVTFYEQGDANMLKIDGSRLYKHGEGKWIDSGKSGVWVSETCFVCEGKCYKEEDLKWVVEQEVAGPIPKKIEEEEKKKEEEQKEQEGGLKAEAKEGTVVELALPSAPKEESGKIEFSESSTVSAEELKKEIDEKVEKAKLLANEATPAM